MLLQLDWLYENGAVPQEGAKALVTFLGFESYPVPPNSKHHYRHGIWDRDEIGDPSSNARNERIHRTAANRSGRVAGFVPQLEEIYAVINEKYEQFQEGKHAKRGRIINEMKRQNAPCRPDCNSAQCAERRNLLAHRFGVDTFPCKHMATTFTFPPERRTTRLTSSPSACLSIPPKVSPVAESWPFPQRHVVPPAPPLFPFNSNPFVPWPQMTGPF